MSPPLDTTTLAEKLAPVREGEEAPHPKAVEATQKKIQKTMAGMSFGTVIGVFCLLLAWRVFEVSLLGIGMMGLCLVGALFAGGIMDQETLVKLAAIVFKKKEEG